jgi:diguanylate cyclase (GGDEF)-like protein/PAS domain S-box-containing protein
MGYKTLLVNENPEILEFCNQHLKNMGYDVDVADRPEKAKDMANSSQYDLIISDTDIHESSVLELMAQVHETNPDLPFLVIAGSSDDTKYEEIIEKGAADYLVKPFDDKRFRSTVLRITKDHEKLNTAKKAQSQAQEAVRKLEQIIESVNPMVVIKKTEDGRCKYVQCNTPFLDGMQRSVMDIIGSYCEYEEKPGMCDICPAEIVAKTGKSAWASAVLKGKKILMSATPLNETDKRIDSIVASFSDLTELDRMKDKYAELFESSIEARYISNNKGKIIMANSAFCKMFGYDKQELANLDATELYVEPDDRADLIIRMYAHGSIDAYKVRLKTKTGKELSCEITANTHDEDGNYTEYMGSVKDVTELEETRRLLQRQAARDGLTGLYNQQQFHLMFKKEITECRRYETELSFLLLDVDNFKQYNDTYGHYEGDRVLEGLGRLLLNGRESDLPFRYGGEEFAVLLPNTSIDNALIVADRIRLDFSNTVFKTKEGIDTSCTVSIGAAQYDKISKPEDFYRQVDKKLYDAKDNGRNCVKS